MTERAIDRLVAKAKNARDGRRPKVWHFIRENWPKFQRLVRREGVTYRALAGMLADEPEVQESGKGPSEFAIRRAFVSVESLMDPGGQKKEVVETRRARTRAKAAPEVPTERSEGGTVDAEISAEPEQPRRKFRRTAARFIGEGDNGD